MAKAVFTTKVEPTYDDLPEERYHFPRTYLRQVEATIGDWIVYYEPRRTTSEIGSRGGRQALDLVGRKLAKDGGRAMMAFFSEVRTYLKERADRDEMNVYLKPLGASLAHLQQASMWFMNNAMAKPDNAGAGSYDYMHLFGLVALGYMWCRIAEAALVNLPKANGAASRMNAKLMTARFFMERMLPETATHLARIQAGAASTMELPDEAF